MPRLYKLETLPALSIDSWVEGISAVADRWGYLVPNYDENESCPAEFEDELTEFATLHKCRFNRDGELVKFD